MIRRGLALGTLALLLMLAGSAHAQEDAASRIYTEDAIWPSFAHADDIAAACGVNSWFELRPDQNISDAGCVVAAMRAGGASETAVRFFETTNNFLQSYDQRGPVDFGFASSPWVNMGRGEAVLLNGAPSAMLMSQAFDGKKETWAGAPGYAELLSRSPNAFPWLEYGGPTSSQTASDGSQMITAAFDMRECRACANVATMPIVLRFDARGVLVGVDVLPPEPPRN